MKRTNILYVGREIIIDSGMNMQYATVAEIKDGLVYVAAGGRKRLIKLTVNDCKVDLGRKGIVDAALPNPVV